MAGVWMVLDPILMVVSSIIAGIGTYRLLMHWMNGGKR